MSIVIAAYNRANVLRFAIESVRWQTLTDWELWVIGDACEDETAAVVAAFDDPRIHFHDLRLNTGEQTGPNNEGIRRARGRYLAFLNQDDLWLPDHLATAVKQLRRPGIDLVWPIAAKLRPDGVVKTFGLPSGGRYEPRFTIPASLWVLRRELFDEIGPWRFSRECHAYPAQDWLFRAWRAGKRFRFVPRLTVVTIHSGHRPRAYLDRESEEHQRVFDQIAGRGFREKILAQLVAEYVRLGDPTVKRLLLKLADRALMAAGLNPLGVRHVLQYGPRKGAALRRLRRRRGLPPR